MQRKEPINLNPVGPAHVYWPHGAPVRKAPWPGIYELGFGEGKYFKRFQKFQ